jgi:type IV fimbrial biogenesis protein FimT
MRPGQRARGVTLIELLIGLTILGILLMLGMPSYTTWIQSTKIRAAAESLQAGLQVARAEAARRNTQVELVLTDTAWTPGDPGAIVASTTGRSWVIRVFQPNPADYAAADFIEGKSGAEGGSAGVTVEADQSTLRFSGTGRPTPPLAATVTIRVRHPHAGSRPLDVTVSRGGIVRMCDPQLAAPNPQAC